MKKFALAAAAVVLTLSAVSFAKDTTVSSSVCYVKEDGSFTGEVVAGNRFFSLASEKSNRINGCVIAKIYGEAETSRLYFNGRRPISHNDGMSNSEVSEALSMLGMDSSDCITYSCEESSY